MKIWIIIVSLSSILFSSEFDYGKGTLRIKGGFLGLTSQISTDIDSFSLVTRHNNFWGDMFYGYDITWYDSKTLRSAQQTYNSGASYINSFIPSQSPINVPEMKYRMKGLDVNLKLGYDIFHKSQDDFLGFGVLLGISMPWIDSTKDNGTARNSAMPSFDFYTENMETFIDINDMFNDSKTKIMSYKVGPTINLQKTLISNKLSVYGMASYSYQTAYIKNSYAHSKFTVNGTFKEYNVGLYFTPFTQKYKLGWITLSPRLYATLGYRYADWDLDEMIINISGVELSSNLLEPLAMKFGMDTSIGYFGLGYSF